MSHGSRILIAIVAAVSGFLMVAGAPDSEQKWTWYAIGGGLLLVAATSLFRGRLADTSRRPDEAPKRADAAEGPLKGLREYLATISWKEGDPPPAVDFKLYFEGNTEEESIAPNQWGHGRPPIADLYRQFAEIARRSDVEKVLVGLHSDWNEVADADDVPPAENVHIYTTATQDEVERWIVGLKADGAVKGWPYGKPKNAPDPSKGFGVFSVCWD